MNQGSAGRTSATAPTGESLTVGTVAAIVGVAPSTLRTWARRYGLEPSGHRHGLHRRYSDVDLHRLQLMRALTRAGLSSRDAAERALAAGVDELAVAPAGSPDAEALAATSMHEPAVRERQFGPQHPYPAPTSEHPAQRWVLDRSVLASFEPPVRALLATVARGDAQGATALVRQAVREVGAARALDERVLPLRQAVRLLPPSARHRALAILATAVAEAVGEPTPRRGRRNTVPVLVGHLAGHGDPVVLRLARAALAERGIASTVTDLGSPEGEVTRRVEALGDGVLALYLDRAVIPASVASRVRSVTRTDVLLWGTGWLVWPGRHATTGDLVRSVEGLCTAEIPRSPIRVTARSRA